MAGSASDQWFWNDWQGEPTLRICSFAAQGVWMRCLCIMAEATPKGYLLINGRKPSDADLAKAFSGEIAEVRAALDELVRNGVCGLDRRGVVYNRKMVNTEKKKRASSAGGKAGGRTTFERSAGLFRSLGDNPVDNRAAANTENVSHTAKPGDKPDLAPRVSPTPASEIRGTQGVTQHPKETHTHSHKNLTVSSKPVLGASRGRNSKGVFADDSVTIADPKERLARFENTIAKALGPSGWAIVESAKNPDSPYHARSLAICKAKAKTLGKGWPRQWACAG